LAEIHPFYFTVYIFSPLMMMGVEQVGLQSERAVIDGWPGRVMTGEPRRVAAASQLFSSNSQARIPTINFTAPGTFIILAL